MLLTWHNIQAYQDTMKDLRAAIAQSRVADFAAQAMEREAQGDIPPL
jgi:queuine tRNA-ribosyltransferase